MKKLLATMVLACCGLMNGQEARAGIQVGGTRIIYPAGEKSVSMSVMNNGGDRPYLILTNVTTKPEGGNAPFVASPPLFRLEPGAENVVRISRMGGDLPADRESLFWFTARGLPASNIAPDQSLAGDNLKVMVSASVGTIIKLIYRPEGLPVTWDAGMAGLKVTRTTSGLHLTNPSPYYMSFISLLVGEQKVLDQTSGKQNTTLAPFSSMDIPAGALPQGVQVKWNVLNDFGGAQTFKGDLS